MATTPVLRKNGGSRRRDRSRFRSGVQATADRASQRVHETIELLTLAYQALVDERPPARGRAEGCIRRSIGTLSAMPDPFVEDAMRVSDRLRELGPVDDLPVAVGVLLRANADLLALSRSIQTERGRDSRGPARQVRQHSP